MSAVFRDWWPEIVALCLLALYAVRVPAELRTSVVIQQPVDRVFDAVSDLCNWTIWNPRLKRVDVVQREPDGRGVRYRLELGGSLWSTSLMYTIKEFRPGEVLVMEASSMTMSNRLIYSVVEVAVGSQVNLLVQSRVQPLQLVVGKFIRMQRIDADLARMKTYLEAQPMGR